MTTENSARKIVARSTVLIPFVLWEIIAWVAWSRAVEQQCSRIMCTEQPSGWAFYSDLEALVEYHAFSFGVVFVISVTLVVVAAFSSLVYWVITGKNPFKDNTVEPIAQEDEAASEESGESDDFVPCTNPNCPCASHSNEHFITEWA